MIGNFIGFAIFAVIGAIFFGNMIFIHPNFMITGIFLLMLLSVITGKKKADNARKDANLLIEGANRQLPAGAQPITTQIFCMECGNPISTRDKFCKSCGDSTQEEIQAFYDSQNQ